jgi:hypothetical protein
MTPPIRTLALAAAILLAVPACAQQPRRESQSRTHTESSSEMRIIDDDGSHRMEIRARGVVEINDAGDWVSEVGPGGSLMVEESGAGPERRVEFRRDGDGGVRVRFWENGDERPLDARSREWARGMIEHAVRESGLGAERRVARIRARGGVDAVLAEIARIRNDTGRRVYYHALLASGPMSSGEFGRVMADAGRRMQSDTETRLVLIAAVDQARDGTRLAALLRAAEGIESDTETRLVLNAVSEGHRLDDDASREAFFHAVQGIGSDTEARLVLNAVAEQHLADGPSRDAFFRAVDEIGSDVERRLVLSSVLEGGAPEATVLAALRSTREMSSDTEKRLVLFQVPSSMLRNARVTTAYRQVVESMSSDSERGMSLRRLVDGSR